MADGHEIEQNMSWLSLKNKPTPGDTVIVVLTWLRPLTSLRLNKQPRFFEMNNIGKPSPQSFIARVLVCITILSQPVVASDEMLSWNASAEAGLVYDSNVSIDEVDIHLSKGDGAIGASASVGALAKWQDGIELSADIAVFDTQYFEYDAFNTNTVMLSSTLAYDLSDFDLGLDYFYVINQLDGEKFLSLSTVQPNIGGFIGRAVYLRVGLGFTDKTFYQSAERRAKKTTLNGNAYYFLRGTDRYLSFSYRYTVENSSDNTFDYTGNHVKLTWHEKKSILGYKAKWKLGLRYGEESYDKAPEPEESAQSDTSYSVFTELKVNMNSRTYWMFSYEYFDNNSNYRDQTFTQHIFDASIGIEF